MKNLIYLLFLLTNLSSVNAQETTKYSQLTNSLFKDYSLPKEFKSACSLRYVTLLIESDSKGVITEVRPLNQLYPEMIKSFEYLKGFKIDSSYQINKKPILMIGTIKAHNNDLCFNAETSSIILNVVDTIREQLSKDSSTVILSDVIAIYPSLPKR